MSQNSQLTSILFRHLRPTEKQGDYLVPITAHDVDLQALASELKTLLDNTGIKTLSDFYNEVCDRAEANMAATGTVSGAHWNAMRQLLKEKGVEVTR